MTEKRFTVDYDLTAGTYCLHDNEKAKGVDGYIAFMESEERANHLCDLLNEQHETIQQLKKGIEELKEIGDYQANRIYELQEENEQLKKENKELRLGAKGWENL